MTMPLWLMYMQAGAYAAIMFAVLGVPQVLSGYFDNRSRRRDHLESESSAERRHREMLEERREDRRREDERRRLEEDERRREEERRRQEDERRRQEFELQRQDSERRHQELVALLINMGNGFGRRGESPDSETIRAMQETIDSLESENARAAGAETGAMARGSDRGRWGLARARLSVFMAAACGL